ncbi:MAG: hypothetical protein ACI9S8_001264 [Chlamydiales bacterium]|jgi:hypothetical protein
MKSVNFTREPIIETIITSKEGYKLVVRNSKASGQEEHLVDALEVVSFGYAFFFRSPDRPKAFLVPVTDYEVLEVRETRIVVKHVALERNIKIGGGRDAVLKSGREQAVPEKKEVESEESASARGDRKRERRRQRRRRGGRDEKTDETDDSQEGGAVDQVTPKAAVKEPEVKPVPRSETTAPRSETTRPERAPRKQSVRTPYTGTNTLLPPPSKLISESIERYKEQYGIGDTKNVEKDQPVVSDDKSLFSSDVRKGEENNEVVTEILPQGNVSPERLEHVISEQEFLGEKTGETSLEVFPHKEELVNNKDDGPAFPSMWFPPSSEDDFEDDRYTHPGTIFDASDDDDDEEEDEDDDTVFDDELDNFDTEEEEDEDEDDYPTTLESSEDINDDLDEDVRKDEILKANQGADPEA